MDLNQIIKQLRDIEESHKVAIGNWRDAELFEERVCVCVCWRVYDK